METEDNVIDELVREIAGLIHEYRKCSNGVQPISMPAGKTLNWHRHSSKLPIPCATVEISI